MGLLLLEEKHLDRADKIQLIISYLLQAIILGSGIFSLYNQQWLNAFFTLGILVLTLAPAIIRRNYKVFLPVEIDLIVILFIFLAVFLGEVHTYYRLFWWWDLVLHTSSGFLIGIGGFLLMYILNEENKIDTKLKPGFVAIFGFTFALGLGTFWEIFEFAMDQTFNLNMQESGLIDTMWDLIVNTLGAAVVAVFGYFYLKKNQFFMFDRIIHRFVERNPRLFKKK